MMQNNWHYIIAAYTAAWCGIAGYWVFVHRAVRHAREVYERAVQHPGGAGTSAR
jgi:hypothetical protein